MTNGSNLGKELRGINNLDAINLLLICVILILGGVLTFKIVRPHSKMGASDQVADAESSVKALRPIVLAKEDFDVYAKSLTSRNLFEPLENTDKADEKLLKKAMPELHKRLKLIGILLDSDSKAIVQDLNDNQTHFLSKGDKLGTIVLEDIRENKVIFQYDNERVEMTP